MTVRKWPDAMIDIETLSTRKNALILSIGVVLFDRATGEIGHKREWILDNHFVGGYHVCPRTQNWWDGQGIEAQDRIFKNPNKVEAKVALQEVTDLLVQNTTGTQRNGCRIWGNGPTFDLTIMDNAYRTEGLSGQPWTYGNERDVRTMVDLGRQFFDFDPKTEMPFEGVKHSASDDAEHQAKYVSAIYRKISGEILKCKI